MTALLEVAGITGGYGQAPVLNAVDLTVAEQEIVGVLGANGAGKTSLLRALTGTLPALSGDIRLDGRSIVGMSSWARVARGIALVPEGRHVFGAMTVRENLDVAALVRRDRMTFDDIFGLFPRLAERRDQLAGSLSGGEQQMLAIARALMTGPRLLAVDEMSAGLAPVIVEQLVEALVELRGRMAIIIVEQSPHFVANAVDRVYLLEQGRVLANGTFDDLGGVDRLADLYLGVS